MKKLLSMLLALALFATMGLAFAEDEGNWKVAILTGTTSQGEEEYRAAQNLMAMYPEHVVTDTYPDNFSSEVETTISKLIALASDPDVKAILFVQSVQGGTAAFTQIVEDLGRDDILLIAGVPGEDPADITSAADFVMGVDEHNVAVQIIDQVAEWGCDVFIHYSFARHLSYETIVARLNVFKELCEEYGIELVERDAPDPTGEAGVTGAQQFILEDVPLVMEEYAGKNVAFFSTNCSMQESLQMSILEDQAAYYPLPCCPSPFHGFPASLGIEANEDDYNDIDGFISRCAEQLAVYDAVGRFSTWAVPFNMSMIYGGYEYAVAYINGETDGKVDADKLAECLSNAAGSNASLSLYEDADGRVYDNFFFILFDNLNFGDYLEGEGA